MGSAFVVRTAGNCATDPTVLGSLEYAVSHLGVKVIAVMGHTNCGAIRASFECHDVDNLEGVMSDIESAKACLNGLKSKDPTAIAESNVRLQMRRLLDCSEIIREAARKEKVTILGVMFDISTGIARFI
jgi:carbonic anhydrase